MITVSDIRKQFGELVACDIPSLTINDGDILGLVGNNGAGKTTLFRLLLDLLKPDAGEVTLNGVNPADSEQWKGFVGAYIDSGFLIDFFTPEEYFAFLGKVAGMSKSEAEGRMAEFSQLDMGEVFGHKKLIRDLSAGNKQKVGIMAALFNKPQIVILDEPFNFLDPSGQNVLKTMIADYRKQTGATVIISSHNLAHTVDVSSRIVLLEHGRIVKDLPNIDGNASDELKNYFEVG